MDRRAIFSALLVFCLGLSAWAQSSNSSVVSDVGSVLQKQLDAWNRQDLNGFMTAYWNSEDLNFFANGTVTTGWQATFDRYRKRYQSDGHEMGKLIFSNLNIEALSPDAAFVRGEFHLTLSDGKTPHGIFTLVFRKFPDGWKIVHDHTSTTPD